MAAPAQPARNGGVSWRNGTLFADLSGTKCALELPRFLCFRSARHQRPEEQPDEGQLSDVSTVGGRQREARGTRKQKRQTQNARLVPKKYMLSKSEKGL